MVNSIVGIIGVRAEIIGVRQYLSDGRDIERINDRIALSTKKIESANSTLKRTSDANIAAIKKANVEFQAASAARLKVVQAEQALATNAAKIVPTSKTASGLVDINNRPLSSAATASNTAAIAEQVKLKEALKAAKTEFADLARVAIIAGKAENAAGRQAAIGIERQSVALAEQTRLNNQLAAARRSRLNAATTVTAIAVGATIAVTAGASLSQAGKYETVLNKINSLTSATTEQTKELGAAFLEQSQNIPVSAIDQANAAYVALSSGIKSTKDALEIATLSSKAQVAQMGDADNVARVITAVLNSYGKENIDAATAADILTQAVKEGSAESADFVGNIGRLVGIAPKLNVKFSELSAIVAYLTNTGLTAAEATTALLGILNETAQAAPGQVEALAKVGLTFEEFRANIRDKGLIQALVDLNNVVEAQGGDLKDIFPAIRAYNGLLSIVSNNGENAQKVLGETSHAVGALGEAFDANKDSLENTVQLLKNQFNAVLVDIGKQAIPEVVKSLKEFGQGIQDNRQQISVFISEGIQAIIFMLKSLIEGLIETIKALQDIYDAFEAITGVAPGAAAAVAAIGVALAWALPGGPLLKGLLLAVELIGILNGPKGEAASQKLNDFFGLGEKSKADLNPEDFRSDIKRTGSIENAVKDRFGTEGFGKGLADDFIKNLKNQGVDISKGVEEFDRALGVVNKDFRDMEKPLKNAANEEKNLNNQIPKTTEESSKLKDELKKLAQEFQKSSEAAGQVESLTAAFKKFGNLSKEQADAFGLTASQAGEVQGVDAVINAQRRAQAEAFNYVEAVAAITSAWQRNAAVGRQLALDLAQTALQASQKALSDVFSRPTREVADLNVSLAQRRLSSARLQQSSDPRLASLKKSLDDINKRISDQSKSNAAANRNAQSQQNQQQNTQKAQQRIAQSQLDALQYANLLAQVTSERQIAAIQRLIDANTKQQSDLQIAFRKSNNALQQQINDATGRGDREGTRTLIEEQKRQANAYQANQDALDKSTQGLTTQQKRAQEAEAERQRAARLAEAALQAQQKQIESTENVTESIDQQTTAQDEQTTALEDSKNSIQEQIDAIQGTIDSAQSQEKVISDQIAVYEAQTAVLQAQGVAANQTLLTQKQQAVAAQYFTEQIGYASGQARELAKSFFDFIPGAKDADTAIKTLKGVMDSVKTKIDTVLNPGFDAAARHAQILATAHEEAAKKINNATNTIKQSADALAREIQNHARDNEAFQHQQTQSANSNKIKPPNVGTGGLVKKFDIGGFTGRTESIAQLHANELVLPLSNAARSRQLIAQIPSSIMASLSNKGGTSNVFAPNITVSGETLDTMEATAIRAVQRAFRDARVSSQRSGGLITQGLGPSR